MTEKAIVVVVRTGFSKDFDSFISELERLVEALEADYVIFADTLSPSQLKNITREVDAIVFDRTGLILEIFKRRARTREARLQVEMANLQYMLPRLVGMRTSLGRQAGINRFSRRICSLRRWTLPLGG